MSKVLIIIDPQNDFIEGGALTVPGGTEALENIADYINEFGKDIDAIIVSKDSHYQYHIGHSLYWADLMGNHPEPWTVLKPKSEFKPIDKSNDEIVRNLFRSKGEITIWPTHCIIGTFGWNVYGPITEAISQWSHKFNREPSVIKKGTNPNYEQFGMFMDNNNEINTKVINDLMRFDEIVVGGLASTHCVLESLKEMGTYGSKSIIEKTTLVENFTAAIPGIDVTAEYEKLVETGLKIQK